MKSPLGGRPPFDNLLMFKVLVIKRLYNLSFDQTEYQINDRISFMRFLGFGIGDAAYPSLKLPEGVVSMICEKPNRNRPLTEEQKQSNHQKAKKRCRVEHVFAGMEQMVGGTNIRCKNGARAVFNISMLNLLYNMRRVLSLENPTENWVKRKRRLAAG